MKPLLTIIIPVYNRKLDLIKTLESCKCFDNINHEVIVVDDGSTEPRDCEVVSKFKHCRTIRKKNGGLSSARNAGIDAARGAYLYFLDAGDEAIQNFEQYFQRYIRSNADIGVCSWTYGSYSSNDFSANLSITISDLGKDLVRTNIAPVHSFIVKRVALKSFRFDETYKYAEDWNIWLRLYDSGVTFEFFPDIWARYEVTAESMSLNKLGMLISFCRNIKEHWSRLRIFDIENRAIAYVSYVDHCRTIWSLLRGGEHGTVSRFIRESIRCGHFQIVVDIPILLLVEKIRKSVKRQVKPST